MRSSFLPSGPYQYHYTPQYIMCINAVCLQELPLDELLMGVALLLLEAPAAQQTSLLNLGKKIH